MDYIEKRLMEFDNILGKNHHKICEGNNCECRNVIKYFIKETIQQVQAEKSASIINK